MSMPNPIPGSGSKKPGVFIIDFMTMINFKNTVAKRHWCRYNESNKTTLVSL